MVDRQLCRRLLKPQTLLRRRQKPLNELPLQLSLKHKMEPLAARRMAHPNRGYMHCLFTNVLEG